MEAFDSAQFRGIMNGADLVTPDGMPLVWGLRLLGARGATRVYGPDLTLQVLDAAARNDLPVGFYGAECGYSAPSSCKSYRTASPRCASRIRTHRPSGH